MTYASERGVGARNEDYAAAAMDWAFVLDGATAAPGVDSGCRHDVRWLVERLGAALAWELSAARRPTLPDALAGAIERVRADHGGGCDLGNPDSPSATVAVARRAEDGAGVEYLVLADSAVLLPDPDGKVTVVCDDRLDHLPGGRPYSRELVSASRNVPGGFWVASTVAEAAHEAVTGSVRCEDPRFALLTDGCTRLAEYYGHPWSSVWEHLDEHGPDSLISWVRAEERRHGVPRGKRHDDATALYARP
ncbi:Protein phosphatase 2C [Marinactinospora thermotolerans DSM 45154]|uniref:Protein phosphatase 2C n=1 Tax=Marinactinospora thermotolerans DSM 45154 TaxID=1122192 RepID=A0A1T4QCV1_9ACTN|nr:Protein phosphatase 2C [Marinactinospora thermotolerans DSM 45154]